MISHFYKIIILVVAVSTPCYAFDTINFSNDTSLFTAVDETLPVVSSKYVGWSGNWKFAFAVVKSTHNLQNSAYLGASYTAKIDDLDIDFDGSTVLSDKKIVYTLNWDRKKDIAEVEGLGFGIEFNLDLTSPTFASAASDPVLLADKEGWQWELPSGQTIKVTFSPALADLYFERGNKNRIRAMLFNGITKGKSTTTMEVTTTQTVAFIPPIETRYAAPDSATWHKSILPTKTSPIDLSFLNQNDLPAGKHGFIVANKDKLEFENGTPAKFWGTNVQAYALFSSTDAEIRLHAKRIAKFGYNLVRIHHHDSDWVNPNIFKDQKTDTLELSDEGLRKIDWWVKSLKDEGIYLWIDLQVGRMYTEEDGVDNFSDFATTKLYQDALGFSYYSSNLQSFMKDFNNAYLSRVNVNSPPSNNAIESAQSGFGSYGAPQSIIPYAPQTDALIHAFNNAYLSLTLDTQQDFINQSTSENKKNNSDANDIKSIMDGLNQAYQPPYNPYAPKRPLEADTANKVYSDARGFNYYNNSIQSLMKAFNEAYLSHVNEYTQLALKDDPAVISFLIVNENDLTHHFGNALLDDKNRPIHNAIFEHDADSFAETNNLSKVATKHTWLMGESKIYLNDAEHNFNQSMLSHLVGTLKVKSLISTMNTWAGMGLFSLPSLTDGSIIDVHSYGKENELTYNPRYKPGFLAWMGAAQISGQPMSVTEWNVEPFPAKDRFTAPIYTASIASLQGWDALMHYGYSQDHHWSTLGGSNYSSFNDPSMIGLMPAAALLYRQGHVAPARKTYKLQLNRNDFFFINQNPKTSKTIRTLMETSRFTVGLPETPELPWLTDNLSAETGDIIVTEDADHDFIPAGQTFVESDTKELKRDWEKGIHTINTDKSQVISGWVGGESITLQDTHFAMTTKNAVVAVQSLENKAINDSQKIFITVMAQSQPEQGVALPFISEPVVGQLEIKAPEGLRLYPIDQNGLLADRVTTSYDSIEGKYTIDLLTEMQAHWYMLQDTAPAFRITSPIDGSSFKEEEQVTIKTNGHQQEKTITTIDFSYGDNIAIGSVSSEPYEVSTASLPVGEHLIQAHITYEDETSQDVKISLTIEEAPFRITQPFDATEFSKDNPIIIKTNALKWASDITKVTFWTDNFQYIGEKSTPPFEMTVPTTLRPGDHLLRARATFDDKTFQSSLITIKILPELSTGLPIPTDGPVAPVDPGPLNKPSSPTDTPPNFPNYPEDPIFNSPAELDPSLILILFGYP